MDSVEISGMKISRMTLGTAQLGMDYGIANKNGKPDISKAHEILKLAQESAINCLDTAPAYGDSQEIIGGFENNFHISTKIAGLEGPDYVAEISQSVKNSLAQLNASSVSFCLFHSAADMMLEDGEPVKALAGLKKGSLVKHIGASTYTLDDVRNFLNFEELDTIQIPINLFDQRLLDSGLLEQLAEAKKIIFARSIFLQGLIPMAQCDLPEHLADAVRPIIKLNSISRTTDHSVEQLALAFVRDLEGISSLVIGVDSPEQLASNIKLMNTPPLSSGIRDELMSAFGEVPEHIINPSRWESLK